MDVIVTKTQENRKPAIVSFFIISFCLLSVSTARHVGAYSRGIGSPEAWKVGLVAAQSDRNGLSGRNTGHARAETLPALWG